MAVEIQIKDMTATYETFLGWKCKDRDLQRDLNMRTKYDMPPLAYFPDWENGVADTMAEVFDGTVIKRNPVFDPEPDIVY
jgi:hypothetical protein